MNDHTASISGDQTRPGLTLPAAWHEQTEWETAVAWHAGYQQGVADASTAMTRGLDQALAGPTAYNLSPAPKGARDVIQRLVRAMDREARTLTHQPATDHLGGPVAYDAATAPATQVGEAA